MPKRTSLNGRRCNQHVCAVCTGCCRQDSRLRESRV